MEKIVLKGRCANPGKTEGYALISHEPIDFTFAFGVIYKPCHELSMKIVSSKVLVFPNGCGTTIGEYILYLMKRFGLAPKAIINNSAYPITVQGAIISNIPMVYGLDRDPLEIIETGDLIRVNADEGIVEVTKRK